MKTIVALLFLSLCTSWSFAQTKEPSVELQLRFMKTQHRIAGAKQKQQELTQKYQVLMQKFNSTPEVQDLQKQATDAQTKQAAAEKELQAERDEAYQQAGLDQKDYDFDEESLVFTPRAKPDPPTTSPEKK